MHGVEDEEGIIAVKSLPSQAFTCLPSRFVSRDTVDFENSRSQNSVVIFFTRCVLPTFDTPVRRGTDPFTGIKNT
jgi:hypothetical protein